MRGELPAFDSSPLRPVGVAPAWELTFQGPSTHRKGVQGREADKAHMKPVAEKCSKSFWCVGWSLWTVSEHFIYNSGWLPGPWLGPSSLAGCPHHQTPHGPGCLQKRRCWNLSSLGPLSFKVLVFAPCKLAVRAEWSRTRP